MAVLVTGIGYIGAKLVDQLLASGEEVVGVDNLFATDISAIERFAANPRWHFVRGHFGNPRVLAAAFGASPISTVYCLAAQASAHPKAAPARYTESTNLLAPRVLLEAMRRHSVPAIVYASSLRVYGDSVTPETREDAPYGVQHDLSHLSKCYVEKLLAMYSAVHGLSCVAARLGIVYGLSPVMKTDDRFITAPNKFCRQIAAGESLRLYGAAALSTGFIHVSDASAALVELARSPWPAAYHPVNVATEWTTVAGLAAIVRELGRQRGLASTRIAAGAAGVEASPADRDAFGDGDYSPDSLRQVGETLARTAFSPAYDLRSGLAEVLDYFVQSSSSRVAGLVP